MRTHFTTFERDDETEVIVEYTITPVILAFISGPPEDCYPAEGGEVEIIKVSVGPDEVKWTEAEADKWCSWIVQNHDFDDGPDPDDEREKRAEDRRMERDFGSIWDG